jgi:hypothetical protein
MCFSIIDPNEYTLRRTKHSIICRILIREAPYIAIRESSRAIGGLYKSEASVSIVETYSAELT